MGKCEHAPQLNNYEAYLVLLNDAAYLVICNSLFMWGSFNFGYRFEVPILTSISSIFSLG